MSINIMTFNDLFNEYIELLSPLQSQKEIYSKQNRYKNHIKFYIGNLDLIDIKYKHCQEIVNKMLLNSSAPKTAKNTNAIVQTVFNYAIRNDYTDKNPAQAVIIPEFDNKYNISLTNEQIKSLINNILCFENPIFKSIFIFALHGRRLNEILSMTWNQIDFSMKIYNIPPQKNKSKKNDFHEMTEILYNTLNNQFIQNSKYNLTKSNDYVFINPKTLTRYVDIRKQFNKLKDSSCIKSFRFHDFRHLLVTYTLNDKKENIEHISQALGHSSIEVTQKYLTKDFKISRQICNSLINDFIPKDYNV